MEKMFKVFAIEKLPREEKKFVKDTIESTFNLKTELIDVNEREIRFAYNPYRDQYNAEKILSSYARKTRNFLVILEDDIYVEGLNFVFGVAYPQIGVVISTYRLKINATKELFYERLYKTIKHEIGHYYGLKHCKNPCVMRFANSLYELDIKNSDFCETCKKKLKTINALKGLDH